MKDKLSVKYIGSHGRFRERCMIPIPFRTSRLTLFNVVKVHGGYFMPVDENYCDIFEVN